MPSVQRPSDKATPKAILRWPSELARRWTFSFVESAANDANISAIIAIGSAVRPSVPSNDLDLVVICNVPSELDVKPPLEIDLRPFAESQVEALLCEGHDLLAWSLMFGVLLFERDQRWSEVLQRWQYRIPLPSPAVAKSRANASLRRMREVAALGDQGAANEQGISYLTHLARAELSSRGIFPASRPELPQQLRAAGVFKLADVLDGLLLGQATALSPELLEDLAGV